MLCIKLCKQKVLTLSWSRTCRCSIHTLKVVSWRMGLSSILRSDAEVGSLAEYRWILSISTHT